MTVFFELFEKNQNILQMNGIRARNHVGFVKKFQREVGQINTQKRVKTDKSRCIDKGPFINYVDKTLPVFDHVCMCVDKIFTLNVDKNRYFSEHVCMSSCPCSLWMVPNFT